MEARPILWLPLTLSLIVLLAPATGQVSALSSKYVPVIFTNDNSDLPNFPVRALAATEDGLWVGTGGGGLSYFRPKRKQWQVYTSQNSALPDNTVRALAAKPKELWVGTGGGVVHARLEQEPKQWQVYTSQNSALPDNRVWALAVTEDGLWVGTGGGVVHARLEQEPKQWQVYTSQNSALPDNMVFALATKPKELWVGTGGGVVYVRPKQEPKQWQVYTSQNSALPASVVYALAATDEGLWVGTSHPMGPWGGVVYVRPKQEPKQWQVYTSQNSALPVHSVQALAARPDGLWVGTGRGLAHFREGPPPEVAEVIGSLDHVTQSRHTLAVVPFDPTYQTAPDKFRYQWILTSHQMHGNPIRDEVITRNPVKTFLFNEDGRYTVMVTAIDRYGARSAPFTHNFKVALPSPPPALLLWLQRGALSGGVLSLLYLLVLFPLVPLYSRRTWARTALNSGLWSRFPLVHKSLLNSAWARRHLFRHPATKSTAVELPRPYVAQAVYAVDTPSITSLHLDGSQKSLGHLFQTQRQAYGWRPRVALLGRSGSGKTVLLQYLLREMAHHFLTGQDPKLPILLDLRTTPLGEGGVEALIRSALQGSGVELPKDVLDFLISKGNFYLLIDALNEVSDVTALRNALHAFLNRDANNWVMMTSQVDLLERRDVLRYCLHEITSDQARTYLREVTEVDCWAHLPSEAQALARNPQDLALLGEVLKRTPPQDLPTCRADLYRILLTRDQPLAQWVWLYSGEIRAVYGLAFRMLQVGRSVLDQEGELAQWVRQLLQDYHLAGDATVRAVVEAIQRSHLFIQEQEQNRLGLPRSVIGFRHELVGKYLAACYLRSEVEDPRRNTPLDLVALSQEVRWFDVFCFLLDSLDAPTTNLLLKDFLRGRRATHLRLVAYAWKTKPDSIDNDIRQGYSTVKVDDDFYEAVTV